MWASVIVCVSIFRIFVLLLAVSNRSFPRRPFALTFDISINEFSRKSKLHSSAFQMESIAERPVVGWSQSTMRILCSGVAFELCALLSNFSLTRTLISLFFSCWIFSRYPLTIVLCVALNTLWKICWSNLNNSDNDKGHFLLPRTILHHANAPWGSTALRRHRYRRFHV